MSQQPAHDAEQSYLARLKFDPKLANTAIAKFITNIRLVILLVLTIALLGTVAYIQLPRRLNPEVKIPIITVATVVPGASPQDMEQLVTTPIEDELRGLKGLDTITSTSRDNISFITMQFVSTMDRAEAKDLVQSAVDGVRDLPATAQTPQVTALDFEDVPVWQFTLTSPKSEPDLMRFSNQLQEELKALPKIDRVETTGYDIQEISIIVSPEKLQEYGLSSQQLAGLIRTARSSFPAGSLSTDANAFSLTIDQELTSPADIRALQLKVGGQIITLGELATVQYRSKPNQQETLLVTEGSEPKRAVTFYVYKTSETNITDAAKSAEDLVTEKLKHNSGYELTTVVNTSDEITNQFTDLLHEFRSTIILVFTALLLFLGFRQAVISSLTVPLTFLSAFMFMQLTGMSINFLSLFAFLIALGLIVDDTIVVVSAMTMYYRTGKFTPAQTGLLVWKDTIVPIWSTTLTTIWSFVPLLLSTGIIGEFIKPIPIVVTVTMISSTAIAVLVTLPLMIVLLKPMVPPRVTLLLKLLLVLAAAGVLIFLLQQSPLLPLVLITYLVFTALTWWLAPLLSAGFTDWRAQQAAAAVQKQSSAQDSSPFKSWFSRTRRYWVTTAWPFLVKYSDQGLISVEGFAEWYKQKMIVVLQSPSARRQVLWAVVIFSVFSFALLPLGFVKNEFFPKSDVEQFFISLELPAGSKLEVTRKEGEKLLKYLTEETEHKMIIAEIGKSNAQTAALQSSANQVYFTVSLPKGAEGEAGSIAQAEKLRKALANYQGGEVSVIEQSGGPPAGADLQVTLLGTDLAIMTEKADQVVKYLEEQEGTTNVTTSLAESTSALQFVPNTPALLQAGITLDQVAGVMRSYTSGAPLDSLLLDPNSTVRTDVVLRLHTEDADPEALSGLTVTPPTGGAPLPLAALGSFTLKPNPAQVNREAGYRSVTISAAVRPGYLPTELNTGLQKFTSEMELPEGYNWQTGGVNEENAKSIQSILLAMVLSAVLILITMVVQFGSFRQALIVLTVIPLAVCSVFLFFALTGIPLSFPALIGVLSLFGIVVTNSMFIVDKINLNRAEGMPFVEAIADAGASRMEPIILTKLSTVLGLLPITLSEPLWQGLGGAIISGLLLASTFMLVFIPVLYFIWMKPAELRVK